LPARYANAINNRLIQKKLFKRGNQFLLDTFLILKDLFATQKIDLVIYENMQCFMALYDFIKKSAPGAGHIYDAHNVDYLLWKAKAAIPGNEQCTAYSEEALEVEKNLYKKFELCFCCSQQDKKEFDRLNDGRANIVVKPNGVDTKEKGFDANPCKSGIHNILFCGTLDYEPNIEGVLWFYERIFPLVKLRFPDISFTVIGKMHREGPFEELKTDPSVNFVGPVESVENYYRESSLLIVPLLKGSGTRLKILEAMSFGNAVVSTSTGAEGLEITNGKNLLLADSEEEFANAVVQLLTDDTLFNDIIKNARQLVEEKYDWRKVGTLVRNAIAQLN
jgi:glycosyltransferase involved in cell wall biosynthesis